MRAVDVGIPEPVIQEGAKIRSRKFLKGEIKTPQQQKRKVVESSGIEEGVMPHTLAEMREAKEAEVEQLTYQIGEKKKQLQSGLSIEALRRLQNEIEGLEWSLAEAKREISQSLSMEEKARKIVTKRPRRQR